VVLAKIMPIANENRIVFVNSQSVSQFCSIRQPIAVWSRFAAILWLWVHFRLIGLRLVIGKP